MSTNVVEPTVTAPPIQRPPAAPMREVGALDLASLIGPMFGGGGNSGAALMAAIESLTMTNRYLMDEVRFWRAKALEVKP